MPGEETTALVLRTIEFSETSLVVTLLSKEFGRLSTLAKGARRPKGPFEGSLDLLSVCRVVVIRKNTESLDLLTEAKLIRRFRGGQRSLQRVYGGYYIAEMLRLLTDDRDPHPDVYDLALRVLDQIDGNGDVPAAILYFDAQVLRLLGHAPSTDKCTECGNNITAARRMTFALIGGGVVCQNCRPRQQQSISVSQESIDQLRNLQDSQTTLPASLPPQTYGELRAVMNRYITALLGKMPRMQPFLQTAIRTESNS